MKPSAESLSSKRTMLDLSREEGLAAQIRASVAHHVEKKRRKRRTAARTVTVAAALLVLGLWGVPFATQTNSFITQPAHRQDFALSDGSRAELNARTELKADFRYGRRTVRLTQGEAFFSVAKDTQHPFLVETPSGTVRVTGTKFNVRLADGQHVEVTLLEGSVEMENAAPRVVHLASGEQFATGDRAPRALSESALDHVTAWRRGDLDMDGLTLAEIAARLAAYHGKSITVSPQASTLRPGGTFAIDDLPGFLTALKRVLPVEVLRDAEDGYRIVSR